MAQGVCTYNPNSLGLFYALILAISCAAVVQGQDIDIKDLRAHGREAFKNGKYQDAVPSLRLALEKAITNHASDTVIVLALGDLAETLRLIGQYEESEKLFDRAIDILRTSSTAESRYKPIIFCNQAKLYLQTG